MFIGCKSPNKLDFSDWVFSKDPALDRIIKTKIRNEFMERYKHGELRVVMVHEHSRQPGDFLDLRIDAPFCDDETFYTIPFKKIVEECVEWWKGYGIKNEASEYEKVTAKNMAGSLRDLAKFLEKEICGETT
jgi:hypothetical protein